MTTAQTKSEYDKKTEEYRKSRLAHFADDSWIAFDADTPQEKIDELAETRRQRLLHRSATHS